MRYHCLTPVLNESSSIILYGSNGWTFPEQDVNFTLSYPTSDVEIRRNVDNYLITGYEVLLFSDGKHCTGSIASGGLMRNHITLNFAMSGITMLSYELWLPTNSKRDGIMTPVASWYCGYYSKCIFQDTISLTFISEGITTLSYQFWLYGVQRSSIPVEEYNYVMC
ncbi:uncharacterized protein LOC134655510 [Cydia amplana]|uniref:uncharacterized protein LOC134655510 n=1 Tax=Cydia amplana TaxID=1869771 RepID=UPI002FE59491